MYIKLHTLDPTKYLLISHSAVQFQVPKNSQCYKIYRSLPNQQERFSMVKFVINLTFERFIYQYIQLAVSKHGVDRRVCICPDLFLGKVNYTCFIYVVERR